ncbi:hypothetical protein MTR_6g036580 [Medicago truncatula]|uniref:Uncharacterized protein n=1 Tax=Medicago truncatula TaxID=3880 RepID=G7KHR9_MEDTR|nr:hypothetical protein MTR_6g036580 [Medicago truncatula]
MSKWEIFSDANVNVDDNNYKWRQINISNHVIKLLPTPIASPLPSIYDLLLHASTSHLFQLKVWREEDEEGKEISRRWYTIRLIDPQNLMVFFFYK